jgi:hypothetical protein
MKETSVIIVAMAPNDHDHKKNMGNNNSDGAKQPRCKTNQTKDT